MAGMKNTRRAGQQPGRLEMKRPFKIGDHVKWNSEPGLVSGTIIRIIASDTMLKGYLRHASATEPQYMIESDKTDHIAVHKGSTLRLVRRKARSQKE